MMKFPDDVVYALARLKSTIAQCNRLNYCAGAIHELEQAIRLNATAQPVSDKPSLKAMMRALDAFYADESVPEAAMMKAFRILLADVMPAAPGGQDG